MVQPATGHVSVTSNSEDPVDLSTWKLEPVHGDIIMYMPYKQSNSSMAHKELHQLPLG